MNTIAKIIRLYFFHDHPEGLKREVQDWLVNGKHEREKDGELKLLFDETLGDAAARGVRLVPRGKKAGGGDAGRRVVFPRRRIAWMAAGCVSALFAAGVLLAYLGGEKERPPTPVVLNALALSDEAPANMLLDDGSTVWVNENSSVRYTDARVAKVTGEAYFEVKKGGDRPFVVKAGGLSITVHGTKFDVKVHPNGTSVTLYEGEVMVRDSLSTCLMRPGDHLLSDGRTGRFILSKVGGALPAWLLERLVFEKLPLGEVFERIEWFYHVTIEQDEHLNVGQRVTLCLSGEEGLEQVLSLLEQLCGDFTCERQGNRVVTRAMNGNSRAGDDGE
ncbi:MAG: FecR family protein [Odoribacteraceae bacterium]|nr:FecR family protein [Odoribacteraceae bacterium]